MPFEPLRTDEKLDVAEKAAPDMDDRMLFGCSGFLLAAIGVYGLAFWPWWIFADIERWTPLAICFGSGMVPAGIFGLVLARRFGMAGACGTLGGGAATAAFVFLRLRQTVDAAAAHRLPTPEWPTWLATGLPIGWLVLIGGLALVAARRDLEFAGRES